MTADDIARLYTRTISSYGRKPNEEELSAWKSVFADNYFSDLEAALRRWQANTTIEEFSGRAMGARMPTAADLRASIQNFDRANSAKFQPCNQNGCESGWVRVGEPQNTKLDHRRVIRCQCFIEWKQQRASA